MFYPYCTIKNRIEVCHSPLENGYVTVHFEEPDEIYGFKELNVVLPGYTVVSRVGFTDVEVSSLIDFTRCNASVIGNCAQQRGFSNAIYV